MVRRRRTAIKSGTAIRRTCRTFYAAPALRSVHVCAHTWAKSRKLVRNRISVYISVESLWSRFQTTSPRWFRNRFRKRFGICFNAFTHGAKRTGLKVISKPVTCTVHVAQRIPRATAWRLALKCLTMECRLCQNSRNLKGYDSCWYL